MPRNKRGGKKHKKGKNKGTDDQDNMIPTQFADRGQVYATVLKKLGNGRFEIKCSDNKMRKATIPGKFRKRIWINIGDVLLVSTDSLGTGEICTVDHKYRDRDINVLRKKSLINFEKEKTHDINFNKETNIIIEETDPTVKIHQGYDLPPGYSDEEYYDNLDKLNNKDKNNKNNDALDFEDFDATDVNIDDL